MTLPAGWQDSSLARRTFDSLKRLYSIDLICDSAVQPFYECLGMQRYTGRIQRHYDRQSGSD